MSDPSELLAVARLLVDVSASQPSDAQLRRAISTAYYALFHKVLRAAAEQFVGPDKKMSAGYALLYRSFEHKHMKEKCEELCKSTFSKTLKRQLRRETISQDMRDFAFLFLTLQEERHRADYDPIAVFGLTEVSSLVDGADVAMAAFDRTAEDEKADILALLMVKPRA